MKKIRTLVVDDEPLARARILKLLSGEEDIEVLGEGKNGQEALDLLRRWKPDLLFLDIQMPDLSGFDVLSHASRSEWPFVIFVTAFDKYALQAFDVQAVDYLLKPYDDERFQRALQHARQQIELSRQAMLRAPEPDLRTAAVGPEQIEIRDRGFTYRIPIDEIYFVEANGNYLKIYLREEFHLLRQTLQSFLEESARPFFLRIHRSLLLNIRFVESIRYQGNNQFMFHLQSGHQLLSSRSHREEIDRFLADEYFRRKLD